MTQKNPEIITKIIIWLVVEILLNLVNLDTLADYSEYITAHQQSYIFVTDCNHSHWRQQS
jgi:hypothetical protein